MKRIIIASMLLMSLISCKDKLKQGVYEGKDISETAGIIRDKDTKDASLTINTEGNWTLYAGKSDDAIDYSKSFTGTGKGIFPIDVADSVRSYFQLITNDGKAILADKHLPMTGGFNFRDLGGIRNKDGKYVKWGKFIRTDELGNLTDEDLKYLSSIPVTSIIDFRSKQEVSALPDKLPESVKDYIELNITPGNLNVGSIEEIPDMNFDSLMVAMNQLFVTDSVIIGQYRKFFEILQNENNLPLIFHCTAGKDRTGMGAALILFALNVDEATIMKDYLASNIYLKDKYSGLLEKYPKLEPMFGVKPEFLQASIDLIKQKYGSVDKYLTDVLKVDLDKFRKNNLYP